MICCYSRIASGYLGKETTVACNLMDSLATGFQAANQDDDAEAFKDDAARIRQHIARNMDGEVDTPSWCD
jgi:hypothetical protein